jgi:hypothetical protein
MSTPDLNLLVTLEAADIDAEGITVAEAKAALLPGLPKDLYPGGTKTGWWLKAVQLGLEAKGMIRRGPARPVRLFRSTEQV